MQNRRSGLETRLARLVAATTPVVIYRPARRSRIDLVYVSEDDQERLETFLKLTHVGGGVKGSARGLWITNSHPQV